MKILLDRRSVPDASPGDRQKSPSPEAISVAAQATALPVERITEVRVFDPYFL